MIVIAGIGAYLFFHGFPITGVFLAVFGLWSMLLFIKNNS